MPESKLATGICVPLSGAWIFFSAIPRAVAGALRLPGICLISFLSTGRAPGKLRHIRQDRDSICTGFDKLQ